MSLNDRARQFLPFDALKGLREALRIKEYEHERIQKGDLSEDIINKISNTLMNIDKKKIYEVKYYSNGHNLFIKGNIKLNSVNQFIIVNETKILFDDLLDIRIVE